MLCGNNLPKGISGDNVSDVWFLNSRKAIIKPHCVSRRPSECHVNIQNPVTDTEQVRSPSTEVTLAKPKGKS